MNGDAGGVGVAERASQLVQCRGNRQPEEQAECSEGSDEEDENRGGFGHSATREPFHTWSHGGREGEREEQASVLRSSRTESASSPIPIGGDGAIVSSSNLQTGR